MIVTKKEAPSSMAVELGATTKILQDDCITLSKEEYINLRDNYVRLGTKVDMIINAVEMLRYDSDRIKAVRYILGIPEEVTE